MNQLITISKSMFDQLLNRVAKLEETVFKNSEVTHMVGIYKNEKNKGKLKKLKKIDDLFI